MKKVNGSNTSLLTSIILAFLMARIVYMLAIDGTSGLKALSGWIYLAFISIIYFLMLYTGNVHLYRTIFFASIAISFFPTFILGNIEARGHMFVTEADKMQGGFFFCHLVLPMLIVTYFFTGYIYFPTKISGHFASLSMFLIIWLLSVIILGKGWCSWVCWFGGWEDAISNIRKKPLLNINYPKDSLRYFGYAMLLFLILATLPSLTPVYCKLFCPFKIITEYEQVTGFRTFISLIFLIILFVGLVIVMPYITKKRFQCTTFCPFGAMQSLIGRISVYRIKIDKSRCVGCMRCVEICPCLAMTKELIAGKGCIPLRMCTLCGNCIKACPQNAISYQFVKGNDVIEKLLSKLLKKIPAKDRLPSRFCRVLVRTLRELLTPNALFTFTAMTFGVTISSLFSAELIYRILNLFVNGSFFAGA